VQAVLTRLQNGHSIHIWHSN